MTPYQWRRCFFDYWERVDPNIRKLARPFSLEQIRAMQNIAGSVWYGEHCSNCFLEPRSVEDAISFAITAVFEMSHPEFDELRRTVH